MGNVRMIQKNTNTIKILDTDSFIVEYFIDTHEYRVAYFQDFHFQDEVRFKDICNSIGAGWVPCDKQLPTCAPGTEVGPLLFQLKESETTEIGYYGEGGKYRDKYFRTYRDTTEGWDASDVMMWKEV